MSQREHVEIETIAHLAEWLRAHHRQREAIWLVSFKKAAGERYVSYDAIVEELLAWGWVDSKPGKVDASRSKLLIAPRKAGTVRIRAWTSFTDSTPRAISLAISCTEPPWE